MEKLQEVTDFKVMSFKESIEALEWKLEDDGECFKVTCNCDNSKISYNGFFGTEVIKCESCGKRMTDLFSPIRTGNSTCTILKVSDYDIEKDDEGDDRYWIAEKGSGGIKIQ